MMLWDFDIFPFIVNLSYLAARGLFSPTPAILTLASWGVDALCFLLWLEHKSTPILIILFFLK